MVPAGETSRKQHWDGVYREKPLETVGWYQPVPAISLELISQLGLSQSAPLIDVGGGDSYLADHLLRKGFTDITVLDISGTSLKRAQARLGSQAERIHWVASDILDFEPQRPYALWHDRAAFHFLTDPAQARAYLDRARRGIRPGGYFIVGTFSENGPSTCSGLPVQRYSISALQDTASPGFELLRGFNTVHKTPSGGVQEYTFGVFVHRG
ncbi:class I SAM-dependent methyltransferase [Robiginitalea marina]|uniref:Class I SAM-dependent methyltransferase n=1 Tax=Robiginitalea marina TaxID=2954105 RepID=A0ABT1AYR0_9FLAO|nr:class I SAM-dependent methyltransferase [Robiginitalea marina]MCO5725064.1 class I SAM-dependent methyltransferase [Robiginitalea marina]